MEVGGVGMGAAGPAMSIRAAAPLGAGPVVTKPSVLAMRAAGPVVILGVTLLAGAATITNRGGVIREGALRASSSHFLRHWVGSLSAADPIGLGLVRLVWLCFHRAGGA